MDTGPGQQGSSGSEAPTRHRVLLCVPAAQENAF